MFYEYLFNYVDLIYLIEFLLGLSLFGIGARLFLEHIVKIRISLKNILLIVYAIGFSIAFMMASNWSKDFFRDFHLMLMSRAKRQQMSRMQQRQ